MRSLAQAVCAATLVGAAVTASPAWAQESKAKSCLRTKVWDGYAEGWAMRTMTTSKLDSGATRNFLVTFYPNKEYKISGCGDNQVVNMDVLIYDLTGKVVKRDETSDKQPVVLFKTDKVTSYYVVVHAQELKDASKPAWTALAVTYR